MKHIFIALTVLLSFGLMESSAQSFLKKITKTVGKEIENRLTKEVEKLTGKETEGEPQQTRQEQPVSNNTHVTQSDSQITPSKEYRADSINALVPCGPATGKLNGYEWVDMGLPSGTLWATCNVDATKPEQSGKLYAWGEISTKTNYTRETSKYNGKEFHDFSGDAANDIATVKWGKGWRMPTQEEFSELLFYCNWKYVEKGGIKGSEITNPKTNSSIFLPVTGYMDETKRYNTTGNGMYWTSSPHTDQWNTGAHVYQFGGALGEMSISERAYGLAVRPVTDSDINTETPSSGEINGHKWVDLGLPSGIKWATCNIGADAADKIGNHYAWGEVSTYTDDTSGKNEMYGKNCNDISGNSTYDVARAEWGGTWRIPTYNEYKELMENCTFEWTTLGRRSGLKVTSKTNGNYIFLPLSGDFRARTDTYGRPNDIDKSAAYWSSTPINGTHSMNAYAFNIYENRYILLYYNRYCGFSIRPVSD